MYLNKLIHKKTKIFHQHCRTDRLRKIAERLNFNTITPPDQETVEQVAPPNAPPNPKIGDLLAKTRKVLDVISSEDSMSNVIKRETGVEPATLSLEG